MVNPNTIKALPIANGLDTEHMTAAIRNGSETYANIEKATLEARRRRQVTNKALRDTVALA